MGWIDVLVFLVLELDSRICLSFAFAFAFIDTPSEFTVAFAYNSFALHSYAFAYYSFAVHSLATRTKSSISQWQTSTARSTPIDPRTRRSISPAEDLTHKRPPSIPRLDQDKDHLPFTFPPKPPKPSIPAQRHFSLQAEATLAPRRKRPADLHASASPHPSATPKLR